ncbi:hypothetical protein BjapCC829_21950 [Bradyrhizobium barranii]|uniref:Uncharacterized protein n=1 Tax=Bradyrhizobium barranii TaxID=2992140 RepID=A0ABY3QYF7_9BRAD|nr:hypothetical protein [Bradyrhizobium japonicum]UFW91054.1 hypothetical protein BjapCC829_21950 [Bradyrhizobium japonicum]
MDDTQSTAAALPQVKIDTEPKPDPVHVLIDAWHRDHFAGMPTTELWNASFAAKEDLKKRIAAL